MKKKRVAIIGSREFNLPGPIRELIASLGDIEIVSGGAQGADRIAEKIAREMGLDIKVFKPDFSRGYDVGKYHERNEAIADYCDEVHVFWFKPTPGSLSTIH